jgi:uncharacterized protein (TIGR00156 family)
MKRFLQFSCLTAVIATSAVAFAQSGAYTGPTTKAAPAAAGYAGPSSVPLLTAKELLANGKDDQHARLKGKLLSHKGGDKYEFADQSGKITVEIDEEHFPAGVKIDHTTVVELTGEFDKELVGESTFDVEHVKVAAQ